MKIAILASGNGTNAQAIIDRSQQGILDAQICLICSNNPAAGVLKRAKTAGIPTEVFKPADYSSRQAHEEALLEALLDHGAQALALAGYMRLLGGKFLESFPGPVLNIHPALLPSFPGLHGIADTLAYGVKIGGVSVHFVDENMDTGPLIIQAALGIDGDADLEELEARIHALEHRIYPQALQWVCKGRINRQGRRIILEKSDLPRLAPPANCLIWPPLEEGF